jgi:hypothetical protein
MKGPFWPFAGPRPSRWPLFPVSPDVSFAEQGAGQIEPIDAVWAELGQTL